MKSKICTICGKEKYLSEFSFRKDSGKYRNECKKCNNKNTEISHKKKQFKYLLIGIINRCENKNSKIYQYYGGRGIKCLITEEELKKLWFRDKAYDMERPSIDRINNDGDYMFDNCRFIELSENIGKNKRKPVVQLDLNGNFIKEWESILRASKKLNINDSNIVMVLKNKRNKAGGFKWKYKPDYENELVVK